VAGQRHDPVGDEVDGGVVAGDEQQPGQGQQLAVVQPPVGVAGRHQRREEVVSGGRPVLGVDGAEQLHQAVGGRLALLAAPGHVRAAQHRPEQAVDLGPDRLGNAQQLADNGKRKRKSEARHDVDGLPRGQAVEQIVDQGLHPGSQSLDPAGREGRRGETPEPGVVGRVGAEHVVLQEGVQEAVGDQAGKAGRGHRRVLDQPVVEQDRPGLLEAGHDPGRPAVTQRDPVHGPLGGEPGVEGVGVVHRLLVEGAPAPEDAGGGLGGGHGRELTEARPCPAFLMVVKLNRS
jgi:hypothetical protein